MKTSTFISLILAAVVGLMTSGCYTQLGTVSQDRSSEIKPGISFLNAGNNVYSVRRDRGYICDFRTGNFCFGQSSFFYSPFYFGSPYNYYAYYGFGSEYGYFFENDIGYRYGYGYGFNDVVTVTNDGRDDQIRSNGLYSQGDRPERTRSNNFNNNRSESLRAYADVRSRTTAIASNRSERASVNRSVTRGESQTRNRNSFNYSSRSSKSADREDIATTHRDIDSEIDSDRLENAHRSVLTRNVRIVSVPSKEHVINFKGKRMYVSHKFSVNNSLPVELFRAGNYYGGNSYRANNTYQRSGIYSTGSRSRSSVTRSSSGSRNSGASVTRTRSSSSSSSSGTRSRSSSTEKKSRSSGSNN